METDNFTFACPHCGQHLEAEPDWVGMECECPGCGKALTVPQPPAPKPMITVVTKPKLQPVSGPVSMNGGNPSWWKMIPKWLYGVACAAVVGIIVLVFALIISIKLSSSNGDRRVDSEKSVATTDDGKKDGKPAPLPRPDIKPLQKDRESAQWVKACEEAAWKVVMRFPDKNKGKPFYIVGKITNVIPPDPKANNHRGNIWIEQDGDWKATWVIVYDDERTILPNGNMLEEDEVSVFGTFEKIFEWTGKNKFNADISGKTPMLMARLISNDATQDVVEKYGDFGGNEKKSVAQEEGACKSNPSGKVGKDVQEEVADNAVSAHDSHSQTRSFQSQNPQHSYSPTDSEKMAMGKVFTLFYRVQNFQQKIQLEMTMQGQSEGAIELISSLLLGVMQQAKFEDCPADFAAAAKDFFRAYAVMQLHDAMKKVGPEAVKFALQNGDFSALRALTDKRTWEEYARFLESAEGAEKNYEIATQKFGAVVASYGKENILEWSTKAFLAEEAGK